jgi:hypothetical protein
MAITFETRVDFANSALEAGFTSKAGQKGALDQLNRATNILKGEVQELTWNFKGDKSREEAMEKAYWMNLDLHVWNQKRRDELLSYLPEAEAIADKFDDLAALRQAIKSAEIVKAERKADERVEAVQSTIRKMMELRKSQYARGLELHEIFGNLRVSANVHMVRNQHGTTFIRAFYYMDGKLTPLNMILAVAQEIQRREDAK